MNKDLLNLAIQISIEAGIATLDYYNSDLDIKLKSDNSPLTLADIASNDIIVNKLSETGLPVLSEETESVDFEVRKDWSKFWLVDPLDGTKEFIKKSDEYTINIALIENSHPVLGVVYAPAKDELYYGLSNFGAYKIINATKNYGEGIFDSTTRLKLPLKKNEVPVVVVSKSHKNSETEEYIKGLKQQFGQIIEQQYGSSLKLCMIAEGSADIYPRLGPTMEWDTAASHAIIEAAGHEMLTYPELKPVVYNKEKLLNPFFIVFNRKMKKAVKS